MAKRPKRHAWSLTKWSVLGNLFSNPVWLRVYLNPTSKWWNWAAQPAGQASPAAGKHPTIPLLLNWGPESILLCRKRRSENAAWLNGGFNRPSLLPIRPLRRPPAQETGDVFFIKDRHSSDVPTEWRLIMYWTPFIDSSLTSSREKGLTRYSHYSIKIFQLQWESGPSRRRQTGQD